MEKTAEQQASKAKLQYDWRLTTISLSSVPIGILVINIFDPKWAIISTPQALAIIFWGAWVIIGIHTVNCLFGTRILARK